MSFLKGKLGRSAAVVAFSLGAFQALSIVGATSAFAAPACSVSAGVITAAAPAAGDTLAVYQDLNGGIHVSGGVANAVPAIPAGDIAGCNGTTAGVATTTTINITGDSGPTTNDQTVFLYMSKRDTVAATFDEQARRLGQDQLDRQPRQRQRPG